MLFKKKNQLLDNEKIEAENEKNQDLKNEKNEDVVESDVPNTKEEKITSPEGLSNWLKWRLYLTWYWYAICSFVIIFLIAFCSNIFTWFITVDKKFNKLPDQTAFWKLSWIGQDDTLDNTFENNSTMLFPSISAVWDDFEDETYRFVFKDKNFPKITETYPVYKKVWPYIKNKKILKNLNSLKIWNYNLKNFWDLELSHFMLVSPDDYWYRILFDWYWNSLTIENNNNYWFLSNFKWNLPKEKNIKKNVEKKLKEMNIKIENVLSPKLNSEDFENDGMWYITLEYPQLINWKELLQDTKDDNFRPVSTYVGYDFVNDNILNVSNLEVAKFEVSDYLSIDIEEIKSKFENWWMYFNQQSLHENSTNILVDDIRIVYLEMYNLNDSCWYYIPAVVWKIITNIEWYNWPNYIYQTIVS